MKKQLIAILAIWLVFISTAASINPKDFVAAARSQIGKTLLYDPSYRVISYPNGDIPVDRGVCTDVIIVKRISLLLFTILETGHKRRICCLNLR